MAMNTGVSVGLGGSSGRQSFIDADSQFVGTHTTPNDLRIEGRYEGTIECAGALVVAETADVNAHIAAGTMSVAGHLQGEIICRGRFEILPTGRIEARIRAGSIVVHEGARYEGEMSMRVEGPAESSDRSASRRADARAPRRATGLPEPEPPAFSSNSNSSRSNGRALGDESSASSMSERAPTSTAVTSAD